MAFKGCLSSDMANCIITENTTATGNLDIYEKINENKLFKDAKRQFWHK